MKIAQIAPAFLPIPAPKRGGTERIAYDLTEALVSDGHDVTLFAAGDSQTSAKLKSFFPRGFTEFKDYTEWPRKTLSSLQFIHFMDSFLAAKGFDVIHVHFNEVTYPFYRLTKTPVLITYHFPINKIVHKYLRDDKNYHPVAISKNHSENLSGIAGVVYNGINMADVKFNGKPGDYLVTLGRITPEKGIAESIQIAKKTDHKLYIIGRAYPNISKSWKYFKEEVEPHVDNKQVFYLGEQTHAQVLKWFREAKAFIFPINWEEPFGLVMIEAMAGGTPVIAFDRGSVTEVVDNAVTGFIVNNVMDACTALGRINEIDRKACRAWVEKKFSIRKMTDDYVALYKKIIKSSE